MANRFIKPQKANDTYHRIDRFVKQPFEEVAGALQAKQKNYDTGLSIQNTAEDNARNIATRDIDTGTKNQLIKQMNDEITDTVNTKHGGDYGAAHQDVMNVVKKYSNNPFWERAQSAHAQQTAHAKFVDDARKQGKQVLDFDKSIYNTPVVDEDGNFQNITTPESQIRGDWEKSMKDATTLHANAFQGALGRSGQTPEGYLQSVKTKGITDRDVRNALQDSYIRYSHTDEGAQQLDHLTRSQGLSHDQAEKQIKEGLLAYGMQQKYTEQTTDFNKDIAYEQDRLDGRAQAKINAAKQAEVSNRPGFIPNYTNDGITLKGDAYIGSDKVKMPWSIKSTRVINEPVKDYTPTGATYIYNGSNDADKPEATDEPITGKRRQVVGGWKIVGGDNPDLVGKPFTKGKHGTVDAAQDNNVRHDKDGYYVIDSKQRRIDLAQQAYTMYDLKDGSTAFEEANKHTSMSELHGRDLSGQRWVKFNTTNTKNPLQGNVTINGNEHDIAESLQGDPQAEEIMKNLQLVEQKANSGTPLTQEERDFIEAAEDRINQGYDRNVVVPTLITPKKNEYGAKSSQAGFTSDTYKDDSED